MSDIDPSIEETDLVEGLERKKFSGKKLIIFGGAGVGVLLVLGIIASFLFGGSEKPKEKTVVEELAAETATRNKEALAAENKKEEGPSLNFVDVEEMLFNLDTTGQGAVFLRMKIKLEVDRESFVEKINQQMPRIRDEMNIFMRGVRPADLEGGTGLIFVKEELLRRINQSLAPVRVNDILVESFSIQG